jgi:hypothetical protein
VARFCHVGGDIFRRMHSLGRLDHRVHIPVDGERGFQRIVNADSGRT